MMNIVPDYLNPDIPAGLARIDMPVIDATAENLQGYGQLVRPDEYQDFAIEITRWPATGWRPVDSDTGDEAGWTEGIFSSFWDGDILRGQNEAVGGDYIIGYGKDPAEAKTGHDTAPTEILLWHANYHPDGGQMFFPLDKKPFVVPLALPGDDVTPADFVCFRFDGSMGLYIHADIWHEGVFTLAGRQRFFDRQGAVHARVSVDFAREFDCLVRAKL